MRQSRLSMPLPTGINQGDPLQHIRVRRRCHEQCRHRSVNAKGKTTLHGRNFQNGISRYPVSISVNMSKLTLITSSSSVEWSTRTVEMLMTIGSSSDSLADLYRARYGRRRTPHTFCHSFEPESLMRYRYPLLAVVSLKDRISVVSIEAAFIVDSPYILTTSEHASQLPSSS